jgi:hypothetical protein
LRDHFPNGVFENEDPAPGARVPKLVIHLKVDAEIPNIHSGKTLRLVRIAMRE